MTSINETMVYYYQSTTQYLPQKSTISNKNVTTQQGFQGASQAFDEARGILARLCCPAVLAAREKDLNCDKQLSRNVDQLKGCL